MGGGGHHASDYPRVGPCVEEDPFPGWLRGFPDCFAVHTVRIRSGSTEQAVLPLLACVAAQQLSVGSVGSAAVAARCGSLTD